MSLFGGTNSQKSVYSGVILYIWCRCIVHILGHLFLRIGVKGPWWCCQWLLECDEAAEAEVRTSVKRDLY